MNHTPHQNNDTKVNEQHVKLVQKTSNFISRWSGPFVSLISYSLILGLGLAGIGLMTISALVGLFIDSGSSSGFGFLTGGILLTAGCCLILWKLTRALTLLYQIRQNENAA
ncbi:hypothetical protein HW115_07450 [Verrucomicrobiaceae bacterium N1E253]|uniref:Uncharacterized protein n=1 Tax=Oceaniferula marina TaxID=2748318 RepID=A0A851GHU9_9BACT|nr:hypothetical protein [Oceaniferula marina]NWK55441.1 hypothetical protein [Oceaniferula marina]